MAERFSRITLRAHELPGYRAAVIACSRGDERELCERLLGLLASLEARALDADPATEFTFSPPPGGVRLAQRALEHLRAQPLRSRFQREPTARASLRRSHG
jgi:hypothetical protein